MHWIASSLAFSRTSFPQSCLLSPTSSMSSSLHHQSLPLYWNNSISIQIFFTIVFPFLNPFHSYYPIFLLLFLANVLYLLALFTLSNFISPIYPLNDTYWLHFLFHWLSFPRLPTTSELPIPIGIFCLINLASWQCSTHWWCWSSGNLPTWIPWPN